MSKAKLFVSLSFFLVLSCSQVNAQGREPRGGRDHDPIRPRSNPPAPVIPLTPQPPTTAGVIVFGDWLPTGRCDFTLYPREGYQGLPNPACNDTTSGVDVPFGMSLEICEHDGQGSAGLGKCRRFLPGASGVGDDMNDKGTSFKVERRMIGYMNSADYPIGVRITIGASSNNPGVQPLSPYGKIGYDGTWITQENHIPLPSSCPNPRVIETTKNGDADWGSSIKNNVLNLWMHIQPKNPIGANNWVGIEIVCQ